MQRFFQACYSKRGLNTNTALPVKRAPKPFNRILQAQTTPIAERTCPITLEPIGAYPEEACVIFIDGHVYCKEALLQWLNHHATVPTSNETLSVFAQRHRLRTATQHQHRLLQMDGQLCRLQVAIYLILTMLGFAAFMITYKKPLPNKTAQHTISSISLSLLFFASAYLVMYFTLKCKRCDASQKEVVPPQFIQTGTTLPMAQIEFYYRAFLLPYDPAYFAALPTEPPTLGSPS